MDESVDPIFRAAEAMTPSGDPAHDFSHVLRVAATARRLAREEGANVAIVERAAWLHELFNHPKDSPERAHSGERCAELARAVLIREGTAADVVEAVAYAIAVHPFSRGIVPTTLEARILQDADRLDAIGAIGIARCFATGALLKSSFYCAEDPFCRSRVPDDRAFCVDHFARKLLALPATMHTASARSLGAARVEFMRGYLAQLELELG